MKSLHFKPKFALFLALFLFSVALLLVGRSPGRKGVPTSPHVSPGEGSLIAQNSDDRQAVTQSKAGPANEHSQRAQVLKVKEPGRHERPQGGRDQEPGESEIDEERKQDQPDQAMKWRLMQMVDETGKIAENAEVNAWLYAKQMPIEPQAWPAGHLDPANQVAGINPAGWQWLGPGNIGGRIRSIVIHPTDPQTLWLGSVSGGIWKTTNGGASWAPLDDFMANLAVSSMVIDPTNPNILYAGTGEGYFNGDSIRGAGIFKTTDGGTTWNQLPATATSEWQYVDRLAISPADHLVILAATRSGIWRSTDGGGTWSRRLTQSFMFDVNFDPADSSRAIASGDNGVARYSIDGGLSWNVATGITGDRVEVAYARSDPSIVYASVDNSSGQLYKSTDGGHSYTLVSTPNHLNTQGWYDNALWVDPTNPNNVVIGGITLFRSTNGGTNFSQFASVHADQHTIVEDPGFDGSSNKTVYFGNDGGIFRTTDINAAFVTTTELNNNLGITQFYSGAGNSTSGVIIGGTQDNGTLRYNGNSETWSFMAGGDGGWSAVDQTVANYFYGEFQWLQLHRSSNGGSSSQTIYQGITDAVANGTTNFIAPFVLDPNNPNTLLAGGANLWRSTNAKSTPVSWANIKSTITSNISAIAIAKGNSDIVWVGHNNGNVYVSTNGTAASPTFTQVDTNSPGLPNRVCTRITIDPTNSNRVYATFGGFTPDNVWRTDNAGATWTSITNNLPVAPVRSLVVWEANPNYLYVGTQVGVFASANSGQSWSPSNDGPTNCSVDELFWMNNTLVAATHGRGMFSINISTGQPPSVNITSPTAGSTFTAGSSVTITANATDSDGTVTKVDFFAGSTYIGTATTSPYTVTWNNLPSGTHSLTARATDNSGDTGVSGAVSITVSGGGGCITTPIVIEQTVNGSLASGDCVASDSSLYDAYSFSATAGQQIVVSMSSPSFNTFLIVVAPNGDLVGADDNGGGGTNSRIPSGTGFVTLTQTGPYVIIANSFGSGGVGPYTLSLGSSTSGTIQFSASTFSVQEGSGAANVTVVRAGSTAAPATVGFRTSDSAALNNCNVVTGAASGRCDYITSVGTVRFAAGEFFKNISIPVVDDSYAEGSETFTIALTDATGGTLASPSSATVTIIDNETSNGPNPIDGTAFFVRQQYLDFLNREPDPGGYAAWQAVINGCASGDTTCDQIHVSSSFFRSPEFQERGYFVYRFYPVSFGRKPIYAEFIPDLAKVSGFLSDAELEAAKVAFVAEFMTRPEFTTKYNGTTNQQYVDLLLATAGVTHPARDFWIAALGNGTRTRAQVLREIAESTQVYDKFYNEAFVVMQYFGYLRREPDAAYLQWINHLNSTGDFRSMINGFMNSLEYRFRFGP